MASTFLQLTNRVLRRINEVELTADNFSTVRGINAIAKDAVLDAIQRINKEYYQWPFDIASASQTLVVGQSLYTWPADFRTCDWDSFQLLKDDTLNINTTKLQHIDREQWYDYAKDQDDDNLTAGRNIPTAIFEGKGLAFGVTPNPDKAYVVTYNYFKHPAIPDLPTDMCNIPENYEYIIIDGAMFHMKVFKEDSDGAQLYDAKYKEGIKLMKSIYGRKWENVTDRRVTRGTSRGFIYGRGY